MAKLSQALFGAKDGTNVRHGLRLGLASRLLTAQDTVHEVGKNRVVQVHEGRGGVFLTTVAAVREAVREDVAVDGVGTHRRNLSRKIIPRMRHQRGEKMPGG